MEVNKQIEEMAKIMCCITKDCRDCKYHYDVYFSEFRPCKSLKDAEQIYNAGFHKQVNGEWEWFEEWNPSTPEHPRECDDCGWMCGRCKVALEDMVGGYWDDAFEKPKLNFCPNCGAKMRGGESDA